MVRPVSVWMVVGDHHSDWNWSDHLSKMGSDILKRRRVETIHHLADLLVKPPFPHSVTQRLVSRFYDNPVHSPAAARPGRSCRLCPGRTDGKQLEEKQKTLSHGRRVVKPGERSWYWSPAPPGHAPPRDRALHSQSSLFVLLLSGSLTGLFFSLSSIGRKWAKVRMKPRKFTWSSLNNRHNKDVTWIRHTTDWFFLLGHVTFILVITIGCVGKTITTQTSCNPTPSYQVKHFHLYCHARLKPTRKTENIWNL